MPEDAGPFIHFKIADTASVEHFIEDHYDGLEIAPRTIENALRRGELKFYQLGQKRYTTHKLIDEWLQSCVTTVNCASKSAAAQ